MPARQAGLEVEFSGGVISTGGKSGSSSEVIGIVVALIVLLVMFGALVPALLPLVTSGVGVGIATLGIEALSGLTTLAVSLGHGARGGGDSSHPGCDRAYAATCVSRLRRRRAAKGKQFGAAQENMGAGWARLVTRRPWLPLVGVVVTLGIVALPFLHLQLGLPDAGSQSKGTTERRAYDLLAKGFGPGFNGPLTVVVDATGKKHPEQIANAASKALGEFPNVAAASAPIFNESGEIAIISVTPETGPSSQGTTKLVSAIRKAAAPVRESMGSTSS